MKLTATMMVTLDGVYQGPAARTRTGAAGSSAAAGRRVADASMGPFLTSMFERADGLLLGRKTWQICEPYWPHHDDDSGLTPHQRPAQVRALDHAQGPVVAEHPRHRRRRRGGDPRAQGAARGRAPGPRQRRAAPLVLERDLVDELNLRIYPVMVGDGLRLFPEHGQTHHLEPVDSFLDLDGRDGPDVSPGRPRDLRQRRGCRRSRRSRTRHCCILGSWAASAYIAGHP